MKQAEIRVKLKDIHFELDKVSKEINSPALNVSCDTEYLRDIIAQALFSISFAINELKRY